MFDDRHYKLAAERVMGLASVSADNMTLEKVRGACRGALTHAWRARRKGGAHDTVGGGHGGVEGRRDLIKAQLKRPSSVI